MLLEAITISKSTGAKYLFKNLSFLIEEREKIALIGRNGFGKTTLLKMLNGSDHEYDGHLNIPKGVRITLTKQEHFEESKQSALEYILESVPHFYRHQKILRDYEDGLSTNMDSYLRSVTYFTDHGYYYIVDLILGTLADFGIAPRQAHQPLVTLSGGEKRYVEMVRMMYSRADLLLIDEPTNHMDYKGKERFIAWMKGLSQSVVVVTHDRDVLKHVTKIMELKDQKLFIYKGNYDQYTSQNMTQSVSSVKHYFDQLNRLKDAKKQVEFGLQMRAKSKAWKIRYDHWFRNYEKLKAETVKPSFWIDETLIENLEPEIAEAYEKFKARNITIKMSSDTERGIELVTVKNITVGYNQPLFSGVTFSLKDTERLFIKGRNGAGKSTLVRTLLSTARQHTLPAKLFDGEVVVANDLRIGEYEQEISPQYLQLTLEDAIYLSYTERGLPIETKQLKSLMAQYLFDPILDANQKVAQLSGGQKARLQLIKMFAGQPNLLVLDEPTNHLDLPSIEELEKALTEFKGGIIYISHDSYFIDKMKGKVLEL